MFYTFKQNNVHGFNIENEVVADYLIIEADNINEVEDRFYDITEGNDDYCECCGWRWDFSLRDKDGTIEPYVYDYKIDEMLMLNKASIRIHLKSGEIIKYN